MTFLNAWALAFAGLIPVIVLLYLLKLKRRPLGVSTLLFWQQVLQENRRRAFFQKLRQLLSLLLHLLIFALILAALAKPVLDRLVREGASTVLIIDTRARMQAMEGKDSRFENARQLAMGYARQASVRRNMAVLAADASSRVVVPFTGDWKTLREQIDTLAPTDATGDLTPAMRLAEELLASRGGEKQIVVLTDRIGEEKPGIHYAAVGTPRDNVAITRFATRPLLASPQTSEVLLEVRNFGAAPARGNVEVSFDGRLLDVKPFNLAPGARKLEIFPSVPRATSSGHGWLTAHIDSTDDLAVDNTAYAVLPPPRVHRVLLVSKGNFFMEKLLAADQNVAFELLGPDAFKPDLAAKFDVVIFDNVATSEFDVASAPTNFLFIRQTPFDTGGAAVEGPIITDLDALHPAMRLVNIQNVTVVRAATLAKPDDGDGWLWQAPIRSFEHPLLITGSHRANEREQRIAGLAFDVAESDLPLRVAFPLLVSNTIEWLAGETVETTNAFTAGAVVPLAANETLWTKPQTKFVRDANPAPKELSRGFHQAFVDGFYLVQSPDTRRWVAVNTFSESESDLRTGVAAGGSGGFTLPSATLAAIGGWPLWQHLALAALALFSFEWWLFHRRRTE